MRALLLFALLLCGCETDEVRSLEMRRAYLEDRLGELQQLEASGEKTDFLELRRSIDLAAFLREHQLAARLFAEGGKVRLTFSGTVQECRELVSALSEVRWLTEEWRLRLEKGRCTWEARTGADYLTLENALVAPTPKWKLPPEQLFSRNGAELRATVNSLTADVLAIENRLGESALMRERVFNLKPLVESMRQRPSPCDVAVLDRELALDADRQGELLEVERGRLIHPLEPKTDFRLRGFVEFEDGIAIWHCQ